MRLIQSVFVSLLVAILGWGPAGPVLAGEAPNPSPATDTVIPLAEMPSRANADERFARQAITQVASTNEALRSLAPQLDVVAKRVEQLQGQFNAEQLRQISAMRLESLDRHWRFESRRFVRWNGQLNSELQSHAQGMVELARRRSEWEASLASAALAEAPQIIASRANEIVGELRAAEQALVTPMESLLALGRRANQIDASLQAGENAVKAAIDFIDTRLLYRDSPPLWQRQRSNASQTDATTSFQTGLSIESEFAREYSADSGINQRALQSFRLLLLVALIWLAWRYRRSGPLAQPQHSNAAQVLGRPVSSWLLLVMLGSVAFEPDAPLMVQQLAMLVALIPVLRLLPAEASHLLGWWPYMISGLFLLENLSFLAMFNTTVYRIFQFALTCVALAATLWQLWHSRAKRPMTTIGRSVRPIACIATALLVVALLANVVGNSTLAEMLTSGVVDGGYFGLLLYVGFMAVVTVLHMLFDPPAGPEKSSPPLVRNLARILALACGIGWTLYALNVFRLMRPVLEKLRSVLSYELSYGNVSISLGHVFVFLGWIVAAFWIARITRLLLRDSILTRLPLPRGVGNSVASLTYYALILIGFLFALSAAGFALSQLTLILSALGVGIGFGLQNVVNNFVSGLILMFERPVQPGDVIEFGGTSGRVLSIGMRATTVATFDGADVVVPNGNLLSEKVTNWTLQDRSRRIEVKVGAAYGSDPGQVFEVLRRTAESTPGVAASPPPSVLFTGLGTSSLEFTVGAWTHDFDQWSAIRSELITRILEALGEAGISIPFPQQDVYVRNLPEVSASVNGIAAAPVNRK